MTPSEKGMIARVQLPSPAPPSKKKPLGWKAENEKREREGENAPYKKEHSGLLVG